MSTTTIDVQTTCPELTDDQRLWIRLNVLYKIMHEQVNNRFPVRARGVSHVTLDQMLAYIFTGKHLTTPVYGMPAIVVPYLRRAICTVIKEIMEITVVNRDDLPEEIWHRLSVMTVSTSA